ncbi:hypothetical protein [uncultured Amnibacterium sp.]|uniref:hypothetical protein n=1 Tax=uncultured Amnibacterium sp. TaxID=1631851 RepID=UPI0035CBAFA2
MTTLTPPLRTPFARLLLAAFVVVHVVLAAGPGPTPPWRTALALLAMTAAAALLVLDRSGPLRAARTTAIVLLAAASTALVVLGLPARGWPGYASWPLGAATFVAVGLAMRSRIGAAWTLMAAELAIGVLWSLDDGMGVLPGVDLVIRHAGTLLIGTLFAVGLRRAEASAAAFHALRSRRSLERDTAEAELQARHAAVHRVLGLSADALSRIATGDRLTDDERLAAIALEGRLRDDIALGPLLTGSLDAAIDAARRRGVDVVLLSDPGLADVPTATRSRAADWLAARLDLARGGVFVGRALARDGDVRVSASGGDQAEHRVLSDED